MARNAAAAAVRAAVPDARRQARRRTQRPPHPAPRAQRSPSIRGLVRLAATAAVIAAALLALGVRQAAITAVGYQIDATKRQLAAARAELERLEARLALLAAPDRVEGGALAMGMTGAAEVRVASVAPLVAGDAEPVEAVEAGTVVIQLPAAGPEAGAPQHAGRPGEAGDGAQDSRTLAEAAADLLLGWLGGRRAEAETLR